MRSALAGRFIRLALFFLWSLLFIFFLLCATGVPLTFAGLLCLCYGLTLGAMSWYHWWYVRRLALGRVRDR